MGEDRFKATHSRVTASGRYICRRLLLIVIDKGKDRSRNLISARVYVDPIVVKARCETYRSFHPLPFRFLRLLDDHITDRSTLLIHLLQIVLVTVYVRFFALLGDILLHLPLI